MAANTTPLSAADTNTQMDDGTLNPDVAPGAGRQVIHIALVCENVTVTPDAVYDALDAQFATVAGEKTSFSRGCWIFNIGPA